MMSYISKQLTNQINLRIIILTKYLLETVDVEIKTDRALSESRSCCEPTERRLLNGPRRARSKALAEYFAT
ncbi:hypothetical protein SBF1_3970002 [Candidatus Desulfosporosinus infrequens]|uniref:Uncharacterized protein n=1 Tax=Candidatus Desulfosporosinus infrequens TaxID=2043169 RepID=A0A2U3L7M0_9FIRM|nr:hypothetical protein SBF1_3970002 [Candidatus Desulfosporosinus infrequens]